MIDSERIQVPYVCLFTQDDDDDDDDDNNVITLFHS